MLGPGKFCILQIFKPPFEWLDSYEFCWSLLSRNSCWLPDSGSTPKWVHPSSPQTGWRMLSARKGSCPTGRPFCMYPWLTSSRPRKNLNFSRSSFQMHHTSVSLFTPGGTTRNTLRTSLRSFVSSSKRGCPRSALYLPRLLWDGQSCWRISKRPRVLETLSWQALMLWPARWRLSRPNRCSKNPRRLRTRQSPRCRSNWGTFCLATHSPDGIVSATRCTSVTCGLQ